MTSRLSRLVLLGTAVGIPLFFLPRLTLGPYSLPKLALLIAGVSVAVGLLILEGNRGRRHSFRPLAVPALALVLPLTIAWFWSPYKEWALFGQYSRLTGLLPYALVALLGILVADAFAGRALMLAWGLTVAGGLIGTYAFVQALGLDPFWSPGEGGPSEYPPSTIGHFNFVGGFLAICLPLSIHSWIKSPRFRSWGLWSTVAVTVGLLITNSQGGWIAGLAGTSIVAGSLLGERFRPAGRIGFVGAALVACLLVGTVVASGFFPHVEQLGGTIRQRARLWTTALEMGTDSPLVGRGPGSFAVEAVRYRSLDSVLAEKGTKPDEPHSVPLSFWANAGLLGALGFSLFAAWIIRTGLRLPPADHLPIAFFAACVAYLVQCAVSIDQLPMRSGLWVAMAGMVASLPPQKAAPAPEPGKVRRPRIIAAVLSALIIAAFGLYYASRLVLAEYQAENGREHFAANEPAAGVMDLERAVSFRFEPRYLDLYGYNLGVTALDQGGTEADFIRQMRDVYGYLDDFPDTSGILNEALVLHYWGEFDPEGDIEARRLLERAQMLDPENPLIDVLLSEVLIDLGMSSRARLMLEGWVQALDDELPTYWGALSTARLLDGDLTAAHRALNEGLNQAPSECRVQTARELIRRHENPSLPITATTAFSLRVACGKGGYEFFQAHLPPD